MEKVYFKYNNKKICIDVKKCNLFGRFIGLMFSQREKAEALLFDFKKPKRWGIHSFFVFFPFIAVWLDDKDEIIDLKVVEPFRFSVHPRKPFHKLIEIPINEKYTKIVKFLDGAKDLKR